jgi:hypothetical protein
MSVEVSVKVTVKPQDTKQFYQDNPLSTSLNLQKIYDQIIERETDANKQEKAKKLLRFLIAVEAVENLNDVNAGGKVVFVLPEAVAKLLDGELDLKLTDPDSGATLMCVKVEVGNTTSGNNTLEIAGEFYKDNENGNDKWRPWWRSSTSTKVGKQWQIPLPSEWKNSPPLHDTLDPDNPNSKCVIFFRDMLLDYKISETSKTVKYYCPWSEDDLLMEITKGTGKLVVAKNKQSFNFDETGTGASFELLGVPTIDHLVPQSIGGANHTNNLLTVSQRANFAKGNFFPLDPKSWETRESYKVACKEAANSPATFVNVMRKYINESYKP